MFRLKSIFRMTLALLVAVILVVGIFPVVLSQPPGPQRGPKIDKLRFRVIRSPDAQLIAMQTCEVDVLTDLIRTVDIEKLDSEGFTITSAPGFHMGHIGFNIRLDQSYRDPRFDSRNPATWDRYKAGFVLSDVNFRHACFHAYNQEGICASLHGYAAEPIHSLVPPAQGVWMNPNVPEHPYNPGDKCADTNEKDAAENYINRYPFDHSSCGILRYGGYIYSPELDNWVTPFDLDDDGTTGTTGVCKQDFNDSIQDPDDVIPSIHLFTPTFCISPIMNQHGARFVADCNAIGIPVVHSPREYSPYLEDVFGAADFDMYMVFWRVGRFPDHLIEMCHSNQDSKIHCWRFNPPGINDPKLDEKLEVLKYSLVHEEKLKACHEIQRMLYDENYPKCAFAYMQLYSRTYYNAHMKELKGIINSPGYGSDNSWTYMNTRWKEGYARIEDGKSVLVWCLGEEPERLNPCFAHTVYAWRVIDQTLDKLITVSPYTHEDAPWLATSWRIDGSITETVTLDSENRYLGVPAGGTVEIIDGMKVTFNLRTDVHWQCGNLYIPEDAEFSLEFLRDNQIPRYASTWEHTVDVQVINDTAFTIYSDAASQWLQYDFADAATLLPPPVWSWLDGRPLGTILGYDPSTNRTKPAGAGPRFGERDPATDQPLGAVTQLYGTGPFIFDYYDPVAMYTDMHANRQYFKTTTEIQDQLTEMFHKAGDVNYDGIVNCIDLAMVAILYGAFWWEPQYNCDCDVNQDGIIDVRDIGIICYSWGKQREYP